MRGKTKAQIGLQETRKDHLHTPGVLNPTEHLPVGGTVWEGDSLRVIMCNVNLTTNTVGKDTHMFPHGGFEVVPKELSHLDRDLSGHGMSADEHLKELTFHAEQVGLHA